MAENLEFSVVSNRYLKWLLNLFPKQECLNWLVVQIFFGRKEDINTRLFFKIMQHVSADPPITGNTGFPFLILSPFYYSLFPLLLNGFPNGLESSTTRGDKELYAPLVKNMLCSVFNLSILI